MDIYVGNLPYESDEQSLRKLSALDLRNAPQVQISVRSGCATVFTQIPEAL